MGEARPTPYTRVREASALLCDPDSDDEAADAIFGKAAASLLGILRRLDASKPRSARAGMTRGTVRVHLLALWKDLVGRHVARMLYLHRAGGRRAQEAMPARWLLDPERQTTRQMAVSYARYTGALRGILLAAGLSDRPEPDPEGRDDAKRLVREADDAWGRIGEDVLFSQRRVGLDDILEIGRASIADAERDDIAGAFAARRCAGPSAVGSRWTAAATELARIAARLAGEVDALLFRGEPPRCVTFEVLSDAVGATLGKPPCIAPGDLDAVVSPRGRPTVRSTAGLLDQAARHLALLAAQLEALPSAERERRARELDDLGRQLLVVVVTAAQVSRAHLLVVGLSYLGGLPTIADAVARTSGPE